MPNLRRFWWSTAEILYSADCLAVDAVLSETCSGRAPANREISRELLAKRQLAPHERHVYSKEITQEPRRSM